MLTTVSTVLDTLPNIQRFVRRNLAGGADHMLVFMDAPDEQVAAWLDDQPHVTCVRAYDNWWPNDRPPKLNPRQRMNANVGRALMTVLDPDGWCFHIDADEVVQIDREQLAALGNDVGVVWLEPVEAISKKRWEGEVTHFKTFLDDAQLDLLAVLDVIDEPANDTYFRGHIHGKSGMRPRLDRWHIVHHVVGEEKKRIRPRRAPWARVLHYESHSGEEFVRKWTAKFAAGPTKLGKFRAGRKQTVNAMSALVRMDIDASRAEHYLTRIYEETTADDFETLNDLGLLEQIDPDAGTHVPEAIDQARKAALDSMLAFLRDRSKKVFDQGKPVKRVTLLMRRAALQAGLSLEEVDRVLPEPEPEPEPGAGRRSLDRAKALLGRGA